MKEADRSIHRSQRTRQHSLLVALWIGSLALTAVLAGSPSVVATSEFLESSRFETALLEYLRESTRSQQELNRTMDEIRRELQMMRESECRGR